MQPPDTTRRQDDVTIVPVALDRRADIRARLRRVRAEVQAEADTFDAVYRRNRDPLLRLARLLTGSEALAEDVVHDAFLGLSRNWERVENPGGYLRTSVVNLTRTAHRRSTRDREKRERAERVGRYQVVTNQPELDETWDVLRRLPDRQRAAIVLRFYEDLPEAEIARLLRCRPGTVKSLIHRGLARVREVMS
ncbi:MAG: RNA polymerase sigma factor [Acidimicrobiales bacterium]